MNSTVSAAVIRALAVRAQRLPVLLEEGGRLEWLLLAVRLRASIGECSGLLLIRQAGEEAAHLGMGSRGSLGLGGLGFCHGYGWLVSRWGIGCPFSVRARRIPLNNFYIYAAIYIVLLRVGVLAALIKGSVPCGLMLGRWGIGSSRFRLFGDLARLRVKFLNDFSCVCTCTRQVFVAAVNCRPVQVEQSIPFLTLGGIKLTLCHNLAKRFHVEAVSARFLVDFGLVRVERADFFLNALNTLNEGTKLLGGIIVAGSAHGYALSLWGVGAGWTPQASARMISPAVVSLGGGPNGDEFPKSP